LAFLRNHLLRALTRLPAVLAAGQKLIWVPVAHYRAGFLAADAHSAVGWQLPQPWVTDCTGEKLRLDEALGGGWTILHIGAAPVGADQWEGLGARSLAVTDQGPAAGAIRDDDGALTRWFRSKKAAAVVVRPDGFIYAAAAAGRPLPAPPAGFTELSAPIPTAPINPGVTT
jgi:3-(3-hydroxy-phenyl)propionate hydroxylase